MKRIAGLIVKILLGIVLFILIVLFTVPVFFKQKIRTVVEQTINESVNATVKFDDYKLGFFRNFPNLSFSLNGVSVVGTGKFENDTLAGFKSFDLVFDLSSLFKKTGYEVKSILVDRAVINAIVLKNGKANWDIMKEDTASASEPAQAPAPASQMSSPSNMKISLKRVALLNSSISYIDETSGMKAFLKNINFTLNGDMTLSETDLQMTIKIGELTFIMDGTKYLNKAIIDSRIDLLANLDNMKFTFRENYFSINDLKLNFSGLVSMPENDIETDIKISTSQTSFKSLLSLVPAVYLNDYKDMKASGNFELSVLAKGIYSEADSTLPDIALSLSVSNGLISYPALPEKISNINIKSNVFVDGKNMDMTTLGVDLFHFELAGSPFDMTFALKTPLSDPWFKGSMLGKIDLTALAKAIPMDSINLSGVIDMSVKMEGKMSMIEKAQYENFVAVGTMNIKNMLVAMTGYPGVSINEAGFEFTPAYASMTNTSLKVGGKSDFTISGRIENYIPYVLGNMTIKGKMSMNSKLTDVSEIMSKMSNDTATVEDTTSISLVQVPKNIDFDFDAQIDEFRYDSIKAQKLRGHIIIRDGILSVRDAGLNILNGTITMNADYDTRDTLKPVMKADFDVKNISVKDAFNTFNTVKKLVPAAKGIDGKINARMDYVSLLGSDMMPLVNSINGSGNIQSDQITLLESKTFDKMKGILKLGDKYGNTFNNVNISFKIADGRIYVTPFDVKTGNLKMNIGGDQGLDQTLNYLVKTEIPRSDLGGSVNTLIDNLSSRAASFGINFKPSDVLKVNVKVTGTFSKPEVEPLFGNSEGESSGGEKSVIKETVKQTIDNTVDKAKEKAKAEAEAQGAKLIREAEQKGQQLKDEAARGAEQIRKEADIQAKNLIDNAASKGPVARIAAKKSADEIRKNADKKAMQLVQEADVKADNLVEEAKKKNDDLVNKI